MPRRGYKCSLDCCRCGKRLFRSRSGIFYEGEEATCPCGAECVVKVTDDYSDDARAYVVEKFITTGETEGGNG